MTLFTDQAKAKSIEILIKAKNMENNEFIINNDENRIK